MKSHNRTPSVVPLISSSAGIFLLVFGILSLLPGRDTADYLQSGSPVTLTQVLNEQVAAQPRVMPSATSFVVARGRFYHWDPRCRLLNHTTGHTPVSVAHLTRIEAEEHGYFPCDFCERP